MASLTAELTSGDDLGSLLMRFVEPLVRVAGANGGALRVLEEPGGGMHLVGGVGLPEGVLQAERNVEAHCGVCGAALDSHEPQWSDELARCARRSGGQYFGAACRRVLAVPLQYRGRRLGLINLFFEHGHEPGADVLTLTKTVGELLGLALDNARLERENLQARLLAERQALAADVHDSIGQQLAYIKMRLPLLHDAIGANDRAAAERYFDDVRAAVGQAHAGLRGILTQARVPADPLGLAHAVQVSAESFRRGSAVQLDLYNHLPQLRLAPEREAQVFHVVQEALANVARHAGARHAWLRISAVPGGQVSVTVEDDGSGLNVADAQRARHGGSHYGLAIMRERAARLGGTLHVGPRPGGGTMVRLLFPLPAAAAPGQR
jgi:two-component system nitrate/nitrite sensor histidine kinase NarX